MCIRDRIKAEKVDGIKVDQKKKEKLEAEAAAEGAGSTEKK